MKKVVSLILALVTMASLSLCVFAASSPSGEAQADKYNVVGTVTKGDKAYPDVKVEVDGKTSTTDAKGAYKIEGLKAGEYEIVFNDNSKVKVKIQKGTETKFEKNSDGSYNIYVAASVVNLTVDFDVDANGNFSIVKVAVAGNDSPIAPPLGDAMYALVAIVVVSLMGAFVTLFVKKRYSL